MLPCYFNKLLNQLRGGERILCHLDFAVISLALPQYEKYFFNYYLFILWANSDHVTVSIFYWKHITLVAREV